MNKDRIITSRSQTRKLTLAEQYVELRTKDPNRRRFISFGVVITATIIAFLLRRYFEQEDK